VGYGPFPPYTIINPNEADPNKQASGFCIDMVNEIVARQSPPWAVEWHKVSWESLRADMYSGSFDVLANAIYATIPRASEFRFSEPFTYLGVGVGVVRRDEDRIRTFDDLNKPGITVSLAEGWTATEYARQHLDSSRLLIKPVGDDLNAQLNDLLTHRADAVLQDVPTALGYKTAHPDSVKLLWLDHPPMRVAASFITRWEDTDMIEFLNTAIRVLQADGTIEVLDRKWKGTGEYPVPTYAPGMGLRPGR
jgi:cyclohexadienyl dehydratase